MSGTHQARRIEAIVNNWASIEWASEKIMLKEYAKERLKELQKKKFNRLDNLDDKTDNIIYQGYTEQVLTEIRLLEDFMADRYSTVMTARVDSQDLREETGEVSKVETVQSPELDTRISVDSLTPEQKKALENPAVVEHMKELWVISRNGEFQVENPEKLEQLAIYAEYMYFIDNAKRDGEAKISNVTELMDKYKLLLGEAMEWIWDAKVRYLQHKYTEAIYNDIIRRDHIVRKNSDDTFDIVKFDGTIADVNDPAIKELMRVLERDDVKTNLLDTVVLTSIVKNNTFLDREDIVSAKELAEYLISKHKLKDRNGHDLHKVEFSLVDWEGDSEFAIGKQIDKKIATFTHTNTADAQELIWFKNFIEWGDYKSEIYNKEMFTQMNMFRQEKLTEEALMASLPKDLTIDPNNPEKSIWAIVERLGNGNKWDMLVAGFVALLVAKFVLPDGKFRTALGWFWAVSIVAPFILGMTGSVLQWIEREIPSEELEMIETTDLIPNISYDEEGQYKTFVKMLELKDAEKSYEREGKDQYRKSVNHWMSDKKVWVIFEALIEKNPNILISKDTINSSFVAEIYGLLGWSATGWLTLSNENISKVELKSFLELLVAASPKATNIKDALLGSTDIENETYDYLHTITWVDDFDKKLNDYMKKSWDTWKTASREEVKKLQKMIQAPGSKFLPATIVELGRDAGSMFFEEDTKSRIDALVKSVKDYGFTNNDYASVFEDFKIYMEVNNNYLKYRGNILKKSNRESAQDAAETVGNTARSVMADALKVWESGLEASINALLKLGDTWENILRGVGNVAISLIPDWKWAEDAVRGFVNTQIETYKNTPEGKATNGVKIDFSDAKKALDAPDQKHIEDILPGINSTVEKQIENLQEMLSKISESDDSIERVKELKEKIEAELTKVKDIKRKLVNERLESIWADNNGPRTAAQLDETLAQDSEALLREIKEINRYMDDFTSVKDVLADKKKIKTFKDILEKMSGMNHTFKASKYNDIYNKGKTDGTIDWLVVVGARDVIGKHLENINSQISTIKSELEIERDALKSKIDAVDTTINTGEWEFWKGLWVLAAEGTILKRISNSIAWSTTLSKIGSEVEWLSTMAEGFNEIGNVDVSVVEAAFNKKLEGLTSPIESYIEKIENKNLVFKTNPDLKRGIKRVMQTIELASVAKEQWINIDVSNANAVLDKLKNTYFERVQIKNVPEIVDAIEADLVNIPDDYDHKDQVRDLIRKNKDYALKSIANLEGELELMMPNTLEALSNIFK